MSQNVKTVTEGGNVYWMQDDVLWTCPLSIEGEPVWEDGSQVSYNCLDTQEQADCDRIQGNLYLLENPPKLPTFGSWDSLSMLVGKAEKIGTIENPLGNCEWEPIVMFPSWTDCEWHHGEMETIAQLEMHTELAIVCFERGTVESMQAVRHGKLVSMFNPKARFQA